MLQKNPLRPPRPSRPPTTPFPEASRTTPHACRFTSAEDFDATGILAGIDPCESRYWWMPELAGDEHAGAACQATSRSRAAADA